jgi:hypothetical protein
MTAVVRCCAQYIAEGYSSRVLALSLKSLPIPEWQRNGRSRYEGRIQEQRPKKQRSSWLDSLKRYLKSQLGSKSFERRLKLSSRVFLLFLFLSIELFYKSLKHIRRFQDYFNHIYILLAVAPYILLAVAPYIFCNFDTKMVWIYFSCW